MIPKKILWIEDDALNELGELATAVYFELEYELDFALSATEGVRQLHKQTYDAVVVDVRLPPGDDPKWHSLHYEFGADDKTARLGLTLLRNVLGRDKGWTAKLPREARDPKLYGVLSIDPWDDIRGDLESVGVSIYRNKKEGTRVLLAIIEDILQQRNGNGDYV